MVTEEEKSSCRGGEQEKELKEEEEKQQESRVAMMGFMWTITECSSVSFQSLHNKCSLV